jgi:uncharacterized heparinase superfamily protein
MLKIAPMPSPAPAADPRLIGGGELGPPSAPKAPTAGAYWRTLRHLRWSQLGYLALRRLLPRSKAPAISTAPVGLRAIPGAWPFADSEPDACYRALAQRKFTFLNRTVTCTHSIPWNDRRHARLWLYHLNYFDYLNAGFSQSNQAAMIDAALELAEDWRRQNTRGTEVGWEPYPLSLRVVNWLKFLARHAEWLEIAEEEERMSALLESLSSQAATIEKRLEKDLLGNHLLKNAKALLFAGALLDTERSARWWSTGDGLLAHEMNEQILPDGGHFERSPMYHSLVLADLMELRDLAQATGKRLSCSGALEDKIRGMAEFLRGILHPDGEIPLFNDAALGEGCPAAHLLPAAASDGASTRAARPGVSVFPDTGYAVIRDGATASALIFDCGPLGPDYQPGHGHCDVLSYELSLHGRRVVVDTGVSTYEPGPERFYERSSAAHNTLRIDGEEQAEIWGAFRVGRRPRVERIRGGRDGHFRFVAGEYDACRAGRVSHARTILWREPETWIVVDIVRGGGFHRLELFLHFHPSVRVESEAGFVETRAGQPLRRWALEFGGRRYLLATYGAGEIELGKGWHAERFGDRRPTTVLGWETRGTLPIGMIHLFTPAGTRLPQIVRDDAGGSIEIDGYTIPILP